MGSLHNPPSLQWELTANCNHNCIHCYNYWRKDFGKIDGLSRSKTEAEYLDIAKKIAMLRPVSVTLTGGEPLLVFDRIKEAILCLKQNNIIVTMNTNAALLTDEICDFLIGNHITLFVSFICSDEGTFDKISNVPGSQAKVIKGLDLAYERGVKFSCNIVVSKLNIERLEDTIDFLVKRYNPNYISVTRTGKPINSDDSFNSLMLSHDDLAKVLDVVTAKMDQYSGLTIGTACPYTPCSLTTQKAFDAYAYQKICTAGKTTFSIDTSGNFKACPRDSRFYGNIMTDSFDSVYQRMHEWRDGSFVPEECKGCKEYSRCLGGCRVDSIPFTGKSNCLDTISNPADATRYKKNVAARKSYDDCLFSLSNSVVVVKNDSNSYRLSRGKNFVVITSALYNFLTENTVFSNSNLQSAFDPNNQATQQQSNVINNVISRLLNEHIIEYAS